MPRTCLSLAALAAAVALAGCNETAGGAMAGPIASAPIAPSAYRLPSGAPCSQEIEAYNGVVAHDLETGNVEKKVADQIQAEMVQASAACSAGKNGEAHAIVASSKSRHGYRA